ncbi:MAG: tetratricopeptide repeat protein [Chloroflexota bacterium]
MRFLDLLKRTGKSLLSNVYHNWGETFVQRGRNQDAIKACTRSIRLNPRLADSYVQRGIAYTNSGDYERALADFDYALELFPYRTYQRAEILTRRGLVFHYMTNYEEALCNYNLALYILPRHSMTYVYRGMAEQASGNLNAAIADFNAAIHYDKNNFIAYRHRGDARVREGNLRQAIRDYWHYIELGTLSNAHQLSEVRDKIAQLQQQLSTA